jgi:hypothetical protein
VDDQSVLYLPFGRLQNVEVDLDGVKTIFDFEVIEIMGEKDPYPALLGIDWAYENFVVIDIKKELMTFEADGMKVTQPLDPYRGPHFMDLVEGNMEEDTLDHLYTLTIGKWADYINPTARWLGKLAQYSVCRGRFRGSV